MGSHYYHHESESLSDWSSFQSSGLENSGGPALDLRANESCETENALTKWYQDTTIVTRWNDSCDGPIGLKINPVKKVIIHNLWGFSSLDGLGGLLTIILMDFNNFREFNNLSFSSIIFLFLIFHIWISRPPPSSLYGDYCPIRAVIPLPEPSFKKELNSQGLLLAALLWLLLTSSSVLALKLIYS